MNKYTERERHVMKKTEGELLNLRVFGLKTNLYTKGQLSLTNPRDACETFARFT